MEYQLDNSHPRYIEVTTQGLVDRHGMLAALSDLMGHPDYPSKHTVWNFSKSRMGLSMGDMSEIAGVLRLYRVKTKDFANKSALVVPDNMTRSMARIYVSISKLLPFHYKVFTDPKAARSFITNDG